VSLVLQLDPRTQGQPAQQHGQRAPPLPPLGGVLRRGRVADGVAAPQPARHRGVGGGDDEERQHVQQDEGQQVDVLPVDVRRLREVRDAEAALRFLAGGRRERGRGGGERERGGESFCFVFFKHYLHFF